MDDWFLVDIRSKLRIGSLYVVGILVLHGIFRWLRDYYVFDMDNYWPLSIFLPRYPQWVDLITLASCICLVVGINRLLGIRRSWGWQLLIGGVLVLATNLLQGWSEGLIYPIQGDNQYADQYWQDVNRMSSVNELMGRYTLIQTNLEAHSRTHPPGPLIYEYWLRLQVDHYLWVGLVTLLITVIGGWMIGDSLIHLGVDQEYAQWAGLLYVLSPVVQIYGWFTIDAVIASLFIATLWSWVKLKSISGTLLTAMLLYASMMMTFVGVLLVPVLMFEEFRRSGKFTRSVGLLVMVVGLFTLMRWATGFSYPQSFAIARELEQRYHFPSMWSDGSYYVTRLENILEIGIFMGPYLGWWLVWGGRRISWQWRKPVWTGMVMILGLGLIFASGAYATGETARAAMFVFPFLLLVAGLLANELALSQKNQQWLLMMVASQSILMQAFGWYGW